MDAPHPGHARPKRGDARQRKLEVQSIAVELEQAALAPVVPGELIGWCQSITEPLTRLLTVWGSRQRDQSELQQRISDQDAVMAYRVATLAERARRHHAELQDLRVSLTRIATAGSGEASGSLDEARQLRSRVLYWTVAVRALERELDTWLVELPDQQRGRQRAVAG